ncbi:hypothetical protein ABT095_25070 [Kitasatospora sp. NPDC002227]|uniref:hypothetical protein n=1 Tax=Kitasatospora sp. NPDC002227 TaxID=3154773 RepID=UPI00332728FD
MTIEEREFLELSQALTGFDRDELAATGQVSAHRATAVQRLGPEPYRRLLAALAAAAGEPDALPEGPEREHARAVCGLWYLGHWPGTGDEPPAAGAAEAYAAGLVWRTFGGRAPGTAAPGFGSWAHDPEGER